MTGGEPRGLPRIVVVDDHPIVRKGLVDLIGEQRDMVVCGQAGTIADALAAVVAGQPDVVMIDLTLGSESGLDLVASLAKSHPTVRMLVLSGHDERLYAERALKAGALGYIMKDESASELLAAVRRVAEGKPYVSAETAERIISTLSTSRRTTDERSPLNRLSDRERHVLTLVGRGLATGEIARQLQLSVKTVESHYAHLKQKLGARNSRELTRVAVTLTEG
jgi:DNA-binding NarL/FixJ family response regulator